MRQTKKADTTNLIIQIATALISLLTSVISSELSEKQESEKNKDAGSFLRIREKMTSTIAPRFEFQTSQRQSI